MKIFKIPELRKKILFSLLIVVIFRFLIHVPVPGINVEAIKSYLQGSVFFGLFDMFSGGGFQHFSIVTLGLAPYINASIIIQLLTMMIPSWEEMSKEGEYGREKLNMYTKYLTVPMAVFQAYGIYFLFSRQGVIPSLGGFDLSTLILTLLAGTMLLVWLGDLVTEYGISNGVSLLIFVSIIGRLPSAVLGFVSSISIDNLFGATVFLTLALLVIVCVVLVNEGTRNIVIEYGRRGVRSEKVTNYLPIKINQAGVIPIIFAVSIVMVPSLIGGPLQAAQNQNLRQIGYFMISTFHSNSLIYNLTYFLLVVGFTFFYTFVQFNPEKIAEDVKKRGGFIPGIRPGTATSTYLKNIVSRITLAGALFLGIIAILPYFMQTFMNVGNLTIGGTGLLIAVSVVLEMVNQVNSLVATRSYEKFLY